MPVHSLTRRRNFAGRVIDGYFLRSIVGTGANGTVYRGVDVTRKNSPILAIKCVYGGNHPHHWYQLMDEVKNHEAAARYTNVLELYDVTEYRGHCFFVMPLCESDMHRAIWSANAYWRKDRLIKDVFIDVLNGVLGCHRSGVFHRDLKPENILCDSEGRHIQIADFGLSTTDRVCRDGRCGTLGYMSPECSNPASKFYYADRTDVWSLGVILFNMVTCCQPWEEAPTKGEERDHLLRLRKYPISQGLHTLLRQIWCMNPVMRPSIPEIKRAILQMDTFYYFHPPASSKHLVRKSPISKCLNALLRQIGYKNPENRPSIPGTKRNLLQMHPPPAPKPDICFLATEFEEMLIDSQKTRVASPEEKKPAESLHLAHVIDRSSIFCLI